MTNSLNNILELKNIKKTYNTAGSILTVLDNANLSIQPKQKVAIVGESGSGKSTFLHIASLLDHFDEGEVLFNNTDISKLKDKEKSSIRNKNFGFVYQSHLLLQEFTVLENVLMPVLIERSIKKEDTAKALGLLEKLKITECSNKFPTELSGGQQQRVAIARALIQSPKIVFADEPTGNLDPETAKTVKDLFNDLIAQEGISLVIVTHDMTMAKSCDKIYHLRHKQLMLDFGEEMLDIIDKDDNVVGKAEFKEAHAKSLMHRFVRVLVENSNGEFILSKRAINIPDAGMLDSAGGHVSSGENYEEAAIRELKEEYGIETVSLILIGDIEDRSRLEKENMLGKLFYFKTDADIDFDKNEIQSIERIKVSELLNNYDNYQISPKLKSCIDLYKSK